MRFLLTLWVIILLAIPGYAQDKVMDFEEKSLPVLNEELRKLDKNIEGLLSDVSDAETDIDVIEGYDNVVQVVNTKTATYASLGAASFNIDDSAILWDEGVEVSGLEITITPASATNVLYFDISAAFSTDGGDMTTYLAMFQDPTGQDPCIAVGGAETTDANARNVELRHYMEAGTTDATTFKFRVGNGGNRITVFNGQDQASSRLFGGTLYSNVTIIEIEG